MEIPKVLPELGEMIPKVNAVIIEYNRTEWAKMRMVDIPAHELVRIGFRLYTVHEYDYQMDAWRIEPFYATVTSSDMAFLEGF
jgi:hypothetical protein